MLKNIMLNMNTSEQQSSRAYCIPCNKCFKDARGLAVHTTKFCEKSSADRQMGPEELSFPSPFISINQSPKHNIKQ